MPTPGALTYSLSPSVGASGSTVASSGLGIALICSWSSITTDPVPGADNVKSPVLTVVWIVLSYILKSWNSVLLSQYIALVFPSTLIVTLLACPGLDSISATTTSVNVILPSLIFLKSVLATVVVTKSSTYFLLGTSSSSVTCVS